MTLQILYGVQGTGNGHISRSREIIRCLKADGHQVRVMVSGRDPALLWDMEVFEPFIAREGLTFATRRGRLHYLQTARRLNLVRFYADIRAFDARGVDLVVTDFEPVSARIARRHRLPSIGIGHQYAFRHRIPIAGVDPAALFVIRRFAPADHCLGLHWHHFDQPILPPVVPRQMPSGPAALAHKVLVYLPFEDMADIRRLLTPFEGYRFFIYHQLPAASDEGHLHLRTYSRQGFLEDLAESGAVITNAGFELASEALHLGKKVLVKPLARQMEQMSNAKALVQLKLGSAMQRLDPDAVAAFLAGPQMSQVRFPDVARMIADWIGAGRWQDVEGLSRRAWERTRFTPFDEAVPCARRPGAAAETALRPRS
jgi:uncharacterized protein (TIGR00661 family)